LKYFNRKDVTINKLMELHSQGMLGDCLINLALSKMSISGVRLYHTDFYTLLQRDPNMVEIVESINYAVISNFILIFFSEVYLLTINNALVE